MVGKQKERESIDRRRLRVWLKSLRRSVITLAGLGAVVSLLLGVGILFLLYWVELRGYALLADLIGLSVSADGGLVQWQVQAMAGTVILLLVGLAAFVPLAGGTEELGSPRFVSWGAIVEGARGPRVALFSGGGLVILVELILLGPRLVILTFRMLGWAREWLFYPVTDVLNLIDRVWHSDKVVLVEEIRHQHWERNIDRALTKLSLIDGVQVTGEAVGLTNSLRVRLEDVIAGKNVG